MMELRSEPSHLSDRRAARPVLGQRGSKRSGWGNASVAQPIHHARRNPRLQPHNRTKVEARVGVCFVPIADITLVNERRKPLAAYNVLRRAVEALVKFIGLTFFHLLWP